MTFNGPVDLSPCHMVAAGGIAAQATSCLAFFRFSLAIRLAKNRTGHSLTAEFSGSRAMWQTLQPDRQAGRYTIETRKPFGETLRIH